MTALKEESQKNLLVGKKLDQLGLPQTLQQEFSLINVQIRNVNMEVSRRQLSPTGCLRLRGWDGGRPACCFLRGACRPPTQQGGSPQAALTVAASLSNIILFLFRAVVKNWLFKKFTPEHSKQMP